MSAWERPGTLMALAAVLAAAVAAAAWVAWAATQADRQHDRRAPAALDAAAAQALRERGAYLVRVGHCAGCHSAPGGVPLAGPGAVETPFGTAWAGNLTPEPRTGLGQWSADDFWQALHHGRGRDGRFLLPAFPYRYFSRVTRDDADAMFAYLRSLPPQVSRTPPHALRWPMGSAPALAVWRALGFRPRVLQPDAARSAEWNRGAYLVEALGHCGACHEARNRLGLAVDDDRPQGGGGARMPGSGWLAPSLRDADGASVATWPTQAVADWLAAGVGAEGSALGPMAKVVAGSTQYWTPEDRTAAAAYLRSLPGAPGPGAVPPAVPPAPPRATVPTAPGPVLDRGRGLYERHCADCHGAQGEGRAPGWPPLAGRRVVTMADPGNLLRIIVEGGFTPATARVPQPFGMPPFGHVLDDAEIAALASWLRQAFGHAAAEVGVPQVQAAR